MWTLGTPALDLIIRSTVIYAVFFGALRLFGKREIGQFTLSLRNCGRSQHESAARGWHESDQPRATSSPSPGASPIDQPSLTGYSGKSLDFKRLRSALLLA
jgi:hypothetical protein